MGGQAAFVGRQDTLADLIGAMQSGPAPAAVVTGLPGSGRTSFIEELAAQMMDVDGLRPVRFDLRECVREPLDVAISAFAGELGASLELTMPALRGWAEAEFRDRYLPNVLQNLGENDRMVIIMDEFPMVWDPVSRQASGAFLPWLVGVMEELPGRFGVVFTTDLRRPGHDAVLRRYFPAPLRRVLGPLELAAGWALVRQSQAAGSLRWSNVAVERVLQLTGGWPYLSQLLCSAVWTRSRPAALAGAVPTADRRDVDEAVTTALDQGHAWLEALWSGVPPAARVVLACVAGQKEHVLPRAELAARLHGCGVRVVTDELEAGAVQELLRQGLFHQRGEQIFVAAPLIRAWLRRAHPVAQELEQLDHAVPEAERLFHQASQLWRGARHDGDRTEAQRALDGALAQNPNHAGAMALLATVHEARGDRAAAVRSLEMLHEMLPGKARPLLVRTLIAQAHAAPTTSEKAAVYRRVLEVAPGHAEATRELARVAHEDAVVQQVTGEFARGGALVPAPAPAPAPAPVDVARQAQLAAVLDRDRDAPPPGAPHEPVPLGPPGQAPGLRPVVERDWARDLSRQTALEATYQGALQALEQGQPEVAQRHLQQVIAERPTYREAARLLYRAVEGVDPEELKSRAAAGVPRPVFGATVAVAVALAATWLLGVTPPLGTAAPERQLSALSAAPAPAPAPAPAAAAPVPAPDAAAPDAAAPGAPAAEAAAPAPAPAADAGPSAAALVAQGWRLLDDKRIGDAELAFDRAVRRGGGADALYGRGYVAEQLGRTGLARRDYCAALAATRPTSDTAREVEARLRAIQESCP